MPLKIVKLKNNKYSVINKDSGKVHSKSTTKQKALNQVKLLNWIDNMEKKVKM